MTTGMGTVGRVAAWLALVALRVLGGELPPAIVAGPYLTGLGPDRVTVSWETDRPTLGRVAWYVQPEKQSVREDGRAATLHHVTLTGLPPATACFYRVQADGEATAFRRFTTAPEGPAPFRFAAYGDSRSNPKRHRSVAQAMEPHQPAFVVHTGDFVTDGRSDKQWLTEFFAPAQSLLRNCPLIPTMGTHDRDAAPYYRYFRWRDEPWLGWLTGQTPVFCEHDPSWLSWTHGDAEFFVLNSYAPLVPGSPQIRWLIPALAASRARWKIAAFHEPLYSSGRHGGTESHRRALMPIFLKHGVDLLLVGHDHTYERTFAMGTGTDPSQSALVEIVTGGGGAPSHKITPGPWTARAARGLSFCLFEVSADELRGTAYDEADRPIDQFTLVKRNGRKDFGETLAAEGMEFLLASRRFASFPFPYVARKAEARTFKLSLSNPFEHELTGELSWEIKNAVWTVDPPKQTVRVAPGGKAEVAFAVAFTPPERPAASAPVPMAILTSAGRSIAVPGFAVDPPPRAPVPPPKPLW